MAKSADYYMKLLEDAGASDPQPMAADPYQQEAPVDGGNFAGLDYRGAHELLQKAGQGKQGGPTPLADVGQGAVHGALQDAQSLARDVGRGTRGEKPESISEMIAGIPGAAIDMMTGGRGGEILSRLDLEQYGPGVPPTPEGELGRDLAPALSLLTQQGGLAAVKHGPELLKKLRGAGDTPEEIARTQRMLEPDRAKGEYTQEMLDVAYPKGVPATKEQAGKLFDEADLLDEAGAPVISPTPKRVPHTDINQPVPTQPGPGRLPQTEYRNRIKKLIADGTGDLLSTKHRKALMADDGMTVKEYQKLRQQIGRETVPPKGRDALMNEKPKAKQRRRAYTEARAALEKMKMPEGNAAVEMYGEARKLWDVAANYNKAAKILDGMVDTAQDGTRVWNSRKFQKLLDNMEPETRLKIFGPHIDKLAKQAKRITYRGYQAKQKAKDRNRLAVWRKLRNFGLLGGVTYSLSRSGKDIRTALTGVQPLPKTGTRGHGADR